MDKEIKKVTVDVIERRQEGQRVPLRSTVKSTFLSQSHSHFYSNSNLELLFIVSQVHLEGAAYFRIVLSNFLWHSKGFPLPLPPQTHSLIFTENGAFCFCFPLQSFSLLRMIKCWAWIWVSERSWFACPELFCHAPNLSSPGSRIRLCRHHSRRLCRRLCRRELRCSTIAWRVASCMSWPRAIFTSRLVFACSDRLLTVAFHCQILHPLPLPFPSPSRLCSPDTPPHFWGWKTETESWNCAAPATNWFPQSVGNFQGVVTFQNVSQFSLDPSPTTPRPSSLFPANNTLALAFSLSPDCFSSCFL